MAAPVTPSQFKALIVSPTANLCTAFLRALIQLPTVLWKLVNYMFTSGGEISESFRRDITPSGTLLFSATSIAPDGYLLANGSIVQREDYPELFTAIGTTYGAGNDDGLTFTLPNFRDRFPLGAGPTYTFGTTGGAAEVTLTVPQLPAHDHGADTDEVIGVFTKVASGGSGSAGVGGDIDVRDDLFLAETGGDEAHNNMPPYFTCYVYIKT